MEQRVFEEEIPFVGHIYKLVHPTTKAILYVGKSKNLIGRMKGHIANIKHGCTPLYVYLRENNVVPEMEIIETIEKCTSGVLERTEDKWMIALIEDGHDLMNINTPYKQHGLYKSREVLIRHRAIKAILGAIEGTDQTITSFIEKAVLYYSAQKEKIIE